MSELLLADFGIRQLHARYADAVWRKDAEAVGQCYVEDGEWQIAGRHMRGRAEISAAFASFISIAERVLMRADTPLLDIPGGVLTGNSINGSVRMIEEVKLASGVGARNIGIYQDRYTGQGSDWRFASREWTTVYKGHPDLSEPFLI